MRKTIASYSDMMTNRKVNSSWVNLHHPTSNCVWPDEIENLGLLSLIMVAWARADQNKGTRVVSDGLSHCCSTPNPLHQTWAHTATYRNMGNRQRCNSLAHILATVKNNSKYQHSKCFSPVLYCVDYGQLRSKWKVFLYFHHVKA